MRIQGIVCLVYLLGSVQSLIGAEAGAGGTSAGAFVGADDMKIMRSGDGKFYVVTPPIVGGFLPYHLQHRDIQISKAGRGHYIVNGKVACRAEFQTAKLVQQFKTRAIQSWVIEKDYPRLAAFKKQVALGLLSEKNLVFAGLPVYKLDLEQTWQCERSFLVEHCARQYDRLRSEYLEFLISKKGCK